MNYYIDFEFAEGWASALLHKTHHFIDLIQVGIVCSDGREYSALNSQYSYRRCNDWVREHVIKKLYWKYVSGDQRNRWDEHNFHQHYGKTEKEIADEILIFTSVSDLHSPSINFYGYYCDYDWVLLCTLYGNMVDLPKAWPMYCRDLKQMLDERAEALPLNPGATLEDRIAHIRGVPGYPATYMEHDALEDARWNKKLHEFLIRPTRTVKQDGQ